MRFFSFGPHQINSARAARYQRVGPAARVGSAVIVSGLVLAGCGLASLSPASETSGTPSTLGSVPATLDPAGDQAASSGPAATAAPTQPPDPPAATDSPAGTAAATAPPTTAEVPVYQTELVLSESGLGGRPFGTDPEDVITYVGSLLGSPTEDSGWVEATEEPQCPGGQIRIVEWGVLSLQFSDASPLQAEGQHFFGWTYGSTSEIGESPEGLRTAEGIGPGSSVAEVKAAYPDTAIDEGDIDTAFPDAFFVPDRYWGLLTGPTDEDLTTQINSNFGCGD